MPGLSGVVTSPPRALESPERIARSFQEVQELKGVRLHHRSYQSRHCVITNTLTGILRETLAQPASSLQHRVYLFLEGDVFNIGELRPLADQPDHASPCEVLLSLYLLKGAEFASLLNGSFNIVIYREREGALIILNDRLSSKPLYVMQESNRLLFGSEKKSILAVAEKSPAIDPLGLLQIFAHRHNLSGRTYIEGIKRLPPGSWLEYANGKTSLSSYKRLRFSVPERLPPFRDLVEEWSESMRAAAARQVMGKQRLLLCLSGGLDSRAVSCMIPRDLRPMWARTRGPKNSLEVRYAAMIAGRLGMHHYHDDPTGQSYSKMLPKIVWRTEGEVVFRNCLTIASHAAMKARGDFVLGGQLGDVSSGAHIYPYMFAPRTRSQFIERAYRWYLLHPENELRAIFQHDFLQRQMPRLKEAFISSFEAHEGDRSIEVYQVWDLLERQARMTFGAGPVDSHLFEKLYPLAVNENLDFVLRIPTRLRFGQTLYQAMIYELGPEIRDVPNANTDRLLRSTWAGNLATKGSYMTELALRKGLVKLGLFAPPRPSAARENLGAAIKAEPQFRGYIESFVLSPGLDPEIFNAQGILQLLNEHYAGARDHAELLCLVATFAAALPYFVHDRPRSCPQEAEPLPVLTPTIAA